MTPPAQQGLPSYWWSTLVPKNDNGEHRLPTARGHDKSRSSNNKKFYNWCTAISHLSYWDHYSSIHMKDVGSIKPTIVMQKTCQLVKRWLKAMNEKLLIEEASNKNKKTNNINKGFLKAQQSTCYTWLQWQQNWK